MKRFIKDLDLKRRQTLIAGLGVLSLFLILFGVSFSFFNYSRTGVKENSIELGSITFKYTENEKLGNGISIEEALPISDELGKTQLGTGKIFDFKVESSLSRSDLEYEIVAEPTENNTLSLDAIKFYMTEITSGTEVELESTLDEDGKVKTLDTFNDTLIEIADGKTIYQETILKNTKGYTKEFRVRMWLREDLDWTDEQYMGKTATVKINVYANSDRSMASGDTTSAVDTSIERVVANNKYLFEENTDTTEEYQYSVTVPNEIDTLDIDVIPSNMDATVEIEKLEDGYAYLGKSTVMPLSSTVEQVQAAIKTLTLSTGDNFFKVTVTSSDKTKKDIYILKVTREKSASTSLKGITVGEYSLVPAYSDSINEYSVTVPYETTSLNINVEASEGVQTITGIGIAELEIGTNEKEIVVTAENGTERKIKITITRGQSNDVSINNIGIEGYNLTLSDEGYYYTEVSYNVESVTLINKSTTGAVVSNAGEKLNLQLGNNDFIVTVTSQSGLAQQKYTIRIVRLRDTDNTLKSLSLTGCTLNPTFTSGTTSYSCTVESSVTSTTVTATANSSVATVTGTGNKTLSVGSNTVEVVVTSQSGAEKTYTVTVTRKASGDATLKSLSVSGYTISPTFESSETAYTVTVPYTVTSLDVEAVSNSSEASYKISGNTGFTVGSNNKINVEVTAGNGTTKTYTITVTRSQDGVNTLSSLSLTNCTLSPVFASGTTSYTCTVENNVTATTVTATPTSSNASVVVNGDSGFKVGENTVSINVTAQNGSVKIYTVKLTRKASSDAMLKALSVSGYTISPTFSSNTTSYTVSVPNSVTSLSVNAEVNNSEASVKVSGNTDFIVGENTINVAVTAGDGTTKTYTITVTRAKNSDATLKSLGVTGYALSPTFSVGTTSYTVSVPYSTDSVTITATATQSTSSIEGAGSKTLTVGANTATVKVTAQDGTEETYTIIITRLEDNDTSLKSIGVTGYSIVKVDNNHYTLSVANSVTSVTVTATANSGVASVSGTGSKTLSVGANTAKVTVTAQDGTISVYEIVITRAANNDATLKSLSVSGYTISPSFSASTLSYTLTVPSSVSSITVNAEVNNSEASVEGTGSKTLSTGNNTVSVKVTAGDKTEKTYTITVKRMAADTITLTAKSATYTGSAISANTATTTSGLSVTYTYYNGTSCSGTALSGAPTNVGEYSVKATTPGNSDYEAASKCVTHTITKKADSISFTAKSTTYTGSAITANTASATSETTITYTYYNGTSCTGTALSGAPTNVGNYSVKAVSAGNSNYSSGSTCVTHTITKGTPTITLTAKTATYTGSAIPANTATATNPNGTAVSLNYTYQYYSTPTCSGSSTTTAPTNVSTGSYSVKAVSTATDNLNSASSACVSHTINPKADTITLSAKSTTYTGSPIAANTASATSGTAITYTYYNGTVCTGTALSGAPTNVGNYSVKATSAGSLNYSSGSACVTHTITKGTPTISLSAKVVTATGQPILANTPTAKNPNGSSVTLSYTYSYYEGTGCMESYYLDAPPSNPGTYSVRATSKATDNLNIGTVCANHMINADTNADLSSLSVTGYSINPNFNASTTSYTLTVEASSITINATKASNVATLSGTGTKTLSWGTNTFSIIVTAQNGDVKTYKLTVTNQQPTAPVITGGSNNWVTIAPSIKVSTVGSAISGVKSYEVYISHSLSSPTNATLSNGTQSNGATANLSTTSTSLSSSVPVEGLNYIWYRTVSNNGFKSNWTSSPQTVYLDSHYLSLSGFAKAIHDDNTLVAKNPTLTTSYSAASDTSGLYKSTKTNSNQSTYYFRGSVTNNYVNFAGQTWRILRINEDGTIRLILQSSVSPASQFSSNYNSYKYMYYSNSTAKTTLNSWFNNKLSNYANAIATGDYYCEQAKVTYEANNMSGNSATMQLYTDYTPSFKCSTDGNGYGVVNSNVGLISYDELVHAGTYKGQQATSFYLDNGTSYWTMSPIGVYSANSKPYMWLFYGNSTIALDNANVDLSRYLRPVINLKTDVDFSGSGTSSDPYFIGKNFVDTIFAKHTLITTTPDLSQSSAVCNSGSGGSTTCTEVDASGLYKSTETNTGAPTYYFRGSVENYLDFAGYTWRVVRINEDGTIRIVMQDGINDNARIAFTSNYTDKTNMYYSNNSNAKAQLETWYSSEIASNENYSNRVVTGEYYCEQAKVAASSAAASYSGASMTVYSSYIPNFKCSTDTNGYGLVNASIGLLSYDEVLHAGGYYADANSNYYLYNNTSWWTMSPAGFPGSRATVWEVSNSGNVYDSYDVTGISSLRPVLNLKADTAVTGLGTSDSHWVVLN